MDPYDIRVIFELMTLELIASQKRTFHLHQSQQRLEGFVWEQWQIAKLRDMARYRRANQAIIGTYSSEVEQLINEILQESFLTGYQRVTQRIAQRIARYFDRTASIVMPGGRKARFFAPQETIFFGQNSHKLRALQQAVRNDIKKAERAVLRRMDDVYRQTLYKTQVFLDSGAVSLNQAIDMATRDFLESGINCVKYKDGRRANVTSYAEMSLRTASQRARMLGEGVSRAEWGIHTVVVTAHGNTCEKCLPWQGKVLIDDVYSGGRADGQHDLLSTAMDAGLLHPNCRHTLATYFPGITTEPEPVNEARAQANYEAEQQQRHLERQTRKWKRIEAGSLDPANQEKAAGKVHEWQGRLKEYLKENPQLRRDYSREKIA